MATVPIAADLSTVPSHCHRAAQIGGIPGTQRGLIAAVIIVVAVVVGSLPHAFTLHNPERLPLRVQALDHFPEGELRVAEDFDPCLTIDLVSIAQPHQRFLWRELDNLSDLPLRAVKILHSHVEWTLDEVD